MTGFLIDKYSSEYNFACSCGLDLNLTASELKVFCLLLSKKGHIVLRDEIAQILWEELWNEKYSDWAIDHIISRLRYKIPNTLTLLTKKRLGFYLA